MYSDILVNLVMRQFTDLFTVHKGQGLIQYKIKLFHSLIKNKHKKMYKAKNTFNITVC